jgi:hypothetical protein
MKITAKWNKIDFPICDIYYNNRQHLGAFYNYYLPKPYNPGSKDYARG